MDDPHLTHPDRREVLFKAQFFDQLRYYFFKLKRRRSART
jgi:hypothetical protein